VFFPYEREGDSYKILPEDALKGTKSYEALHPHKKELLEERRDSGETFEQRGKAWYSLGRYGSPDLFKKNKIAVGGTINGPGFSLDEEGYAVARGAGNARGISPHNLDEYYLLGYLNSRAVFGYLKSIASPKSGGYISIENNVLERVPVLMTDIPESVQTEIRHLLKEETNDYDELLGKIRGDNIGSLVDTGVGSDEKYAAIVREVSRHLCRNHRSLSDVEQSTLEEINHYAVYELVGFSDADVSIIEKNT
jgi:hypothetical protein